MPYVALQQMFDEANAWGFHGYDKGTYLEDLSDEAIEVVADHLPRKSSPLSALLFHRLDEAYSEAGEDDTAFSGGRSPRFGVFIRRGLPHAPAAGGRPRLGPFLLGGAAPALPSDGSYVNTSTEFGDDRVRAAYGPAKYQRLAAIKKKYDPQNLFRHNANIQPA